MTTHSQRFEFSHTIGLSSFEGRGFMNPVDLAFDSRGLLYVLSRSNASNQNTRVSCTTLDAGFSHEFANWGSEPGQTMMPSAIAISPDDRVFVADEHMHNVSVFERDGTYVERWGEKGVEPGQFNRPCGLAFDSEGALLVVDHLNARVQRVSATGRPISSFGAAGSSPGQLNYPWGISIDAGGEIWLADWRNDRIQRFERDGTFVAAWGESGSGASELNRPSDVEAAADGLVYVADWANDRVQVFDRDGAHLETLLGDATLSKWCEDYLAVNPEARDWRLEWAQWEMEKRFWRPTAVTTTADGNVLVADTNRHRVQIYSRQQVAAAV